MYFLFFWWKYWSDPRLGRIYKSQSIPCSSLVKCHSPKESNYNNERDYLDPRNFVHPYPIDVDDFHFLDYSSYYQNMFYLESDGYDFYVDVSDGNEGDIDEDGLYFSNEVLFFNMNDQDYTSRFSQD